MRATRRPFTAPGSTLAAALCAALLAGAVPAARADVQEGRTGAFVVRQSITVPGTPEVIYDAVTGDVSGWWDHSFSEHPARFYLEAKPGGGFWELFDDRGNGVKHATVLYADRGKLLRFEGPLGLSGHAVTLVTTYLFSAVGTDSTRLDVTANCAGEYQDGWPAVVDGVWRHFIVERFKPWVESGAYLERR